MLRVFLKSTAITIGAFLWLVFCFYWLGAGGILAGLAAIFMVSILIMANYLVKRIEETEGGLPKSMRKNKD